MAALHQYLTFLTESLLDLPLPLELSTDHRFSRDRTKTEN
jgi:hypothetical protein